MLQGPASLLTVLLALSAETLSQLPSSTLSDEEIRRQTRKQGLGTSFLEQLGLNEPPPKSNATVVVPPEVKDEFDLISQIVDFMTQEQQMVNPCQSSQFFAQTVTTFAGEEIRYIGNFIHLSGKSTYERTIFTHSPYNLLNNVILWFNFNLASDLSQITQAILMLFQKPASDGSFVRDEEQYVEVKSIIPILSERLITTVIAARFVNIFNYGPQLFEITMAVEQWIAAEIRGEIFLVISTYCISSPLCAQPDGYGRKPKAFMFARATSSSEKAPRIILQSSTNPRERRAKRQTQGTSFCMEGQALCCLEPFTINFVQDLGESYSFILDPPAYQANFCNGICPTATGGQLMTPAVFSLFSQLQNNPASSLTPCCAGYTYGSLAVLLNMQGVLEVGIIDNIKVLSCSCS